MAHTIIIVGLVFHEIPNFASLGPFPLRSKLLFIPKRIKSKMPIHLKNDDVIKATSEGTGASHMHMSCLPNLDVTTRLLFAPSSFSRSWSMNFVRLYAFAVTYRWINLVSLSFPHRKKQIENKLWKILVRA